jgi:arabinose-5-phosphate isomerase
MKFNISQTALNTIQLEAASVAGLAASINDEFSKAIQTIHAAKGRVVISGIGKSAIVAQKIVATLNSTGTPALFMHAADAIHGDLGMVQEDDIVLVISKSGESPEIKVLVPLIRNFGNTLIAIVGNTDSFLARESNIVLDTTVSQEACPNNLAPTSSTTVQMVMGDIIAVCLMELNGFSGRDFAKYHPGGNLGKRLYQKRLGLTAVVDQNQEIIGIITDGDLRRMLEKTNALEKVKAADILTITPKTVKADMLAVEALTIMRENDISALLVADNNLYLGVLHLHDLVREGIV